MRILLLSSFLPYPLYTGGHIRLFNIIKGLAKKHKIVLVCEKRNYQTEDDVKEVEKICERVIIFERKKQWTFWNILKTGLSTKPFLVIGHTNSQMREKISSLLNQEPFDLIHVETFYIMQNLPASPQGGPAVDIPIVLAEHNIEYLVYKRFADKAPIFLKPFLYIDVLKLKRFEEAIWLKANKLIAVSKIEKKIMEKKRRDVSVVPNGVDTKQFTINNLQLTRDKKEKRILFMGDFKWLENRDAANFILEKIWPSISSKLVLWIVGRHIPEDLKRLENDNVIFDENAPKETEEIFKNADILLAPIRIGGGTSYKILEAMASGLPVITSSLGNEGIGAKDNSEILIANNASDFIKNTFTLLEDKNLYQKIAQNARKFIEKNYEWKMIVEKLELVYASAAKINTNRLAY